jgi:hypothetical protein
MARNKRGWSSLPGAEQSPPNTDSSAKAQPWRVGLIWGPREPANSKPLWEMSDTSGWVDEFAPSHNRPFIILFYLDTTWSWLRGLIRRRH